MVSPDFCSLSVMPTEEKVFRPVANFPPSVWGHYFATFEVNEAALEMCTKEVEILKEEVKRMIVDPSIDPKQKVVWIDSLCRLGVSYHFEVEIEEQLLHFFGDQFSILFDNNNDLTNIALSFRVLRLHGFKVPCGVFNKFTDSNERFMESITNDVQGMLSLYEASHLSLHGEEILDEALTFTTTHLKSMSSLPDHVGYALKQPMHKNIPRVEARVHLDFYQDDESRHETILKLAKFDFNRVQMLHQKELQYLSRWWQEVDVTTKVGYARDRTVEGYFWIVGVCFEPKYSLARILATKYYMLLTVVDDTYDAHGTLDELKCFTNAMQRWEKEAVKELPEYMKMLYEEFTGIFDNDMMKAVEKEGRSYSVEYSKEDVKEGIRGYMTEARWFNENYFPNFDEYMEVSLITSYCYATCSIALIHMGNVADINAYEWIKSRPKLIAASGTIMRLLDDVASHKDEQKRGHVPSAVETYMKQYNVSHDMALEEIRRIISNEWKTMNGEMMRPTVVPMELVVRPVNLARGCYYTYKDEIDYYTNPEYLKDITAALFLNGVSC